MRAEILALLSLPSGRQSYNHGHLTPSGSIYRQQSIFTKQFQSTYVSVGIVHSTFSDKRYRLFCQFSCKKTPPSEFHHMRIPLKCNFGVFIDGCHMWHIYGGFSYRWVILFSSFEVQMYKMILSHVRCVVIYWTFI